MWIQVTRTPPPPPFPGIGGGGTGYLFFHYWPPVKREPAINVDMVNGVGQLLRTFSIATYTVLEGTHNLVVVYDRQIGKFKNVSESK